MGDPIGGVQPVKEDVVVADLGGWQQAGQAAEVVIIYLPGVALHLCTSYSLTFIYTFMSHEIIFHEVFVSVLGACEARHGVLKSKKLIATGEALIFITDMK